MSTSDLEKIDAAIAAAQDPANFAGLGSAVSAIPAEEIARIANEFFRALPGISPAVAAPAPVTPDAAVNTAAQLPGVPAPASSAYLSPSASVPALASAPGPAASVSTLASLPSTVGIILPTNLPFAETPSAAYTSPALPAIASAQVASPTQTPLPVASPQIPLTDIPQTPTQLPAQPQSFAPSPSYASPQPYAFGQIPSFGFDQPLPSEADIQSAAKAASGFYFVDEAAAAQAFGANPGITQATAAAPTAPSIAQSPALPSSTRPAQLPSSIPAASAPPTPTPGFVPASPFAFGQIPTFGFGHPLPGESDLEAAYKTGSRFYFLDQAAPATLSPQAPVAFPQNDPRAIQQPAILPDLGFNRGLFDVHAIRRDFPILSERVNGRPLIWLDNAATTQKPQSVIDRISYFYEHENSNIHRAAHELAARATDAYEGARDKVRRFLNAPSTKEIVFVRGATEAINLVAQSWGRRHVNPGDEIVISHLEHHANIVPWQMLASEKGARLRVIPIDDDGQIILDEYEKLLGPKTRIVSVSQVSNALGTVTPVNDIVQTGHRYGARVLIDGAQAVSHMPVDVQTLDCDFYVFSGHKLFAPTGIGVLYGKPDALAEMPPWQGGGNMITDVTFEKTTFQVPPGRFEAGTGNIADAVGLGAAIDYLQRIGLQNIQHYEHELLIYAMNSMRQVPGLHLVGTAREKAGVLSFVLDGYRNEDVGEALNREGIAVRAGHHCAQPSLRRYGLESAVRPSIALYNTYEEIDSMVNVLLRLKSVG